MITPAYVRTMAAYNAEMNRRLYAAAATLPAETRAADQGAFWKSIHGTLSHTLWGDHMWMARFAGWPLPAIGLRESHSQESDFAALHTARTETDAGISAWAADITDTWLESEITWYSAALKMDRRGQASFLVAHMFNHQTHHRGQAHALLTRAGLDTGDTDLWILVPEPV